MPSFFRRHKPPSQSSLPAVVDASHSRSSPALPTSKIDTTANSTTTNSNNNNHNVDYYHSRLSHYSLVDHPSSDHPRPSTATLQSSQSHHRLSQTLDRPPTANLVAPAPTLSVESFDVDARQYPSSSPNPDAPSPEVSSTTDRQSRKLKKGLFHRYHNNNKDKDTLGFLDRKISVKRKKPTRKHHHHHQEQQQQRQQLSLKVPPASVSGGSDTASPSSSVAAGTEYVVDQDPTGQNSGSQMLQQTSATTPTGRRPSLEPHHTNRMPSSPQSASSRRDFPAVQRSNTNPSILEKYYQHSEVQENVGRPTGQRSPFPPPPQPSPLDASFRRNTSDTSHSTQDQAYLRRKYPPVEPSARPLSQQSFGPPSPLPPPYSRPTSKYQGESSQPTQHQSSMTSSSDRPTGMRPPHTEPGSQQGQSRDAQGSGHLPYPQESSFKGNASQQSLHEPARNTPTPSQSKSRDPDLGEIDVRALLQKHEELQAKYSKVKRYYFEKDAQVQHLQNTVAHQRMAVSRTVLDDNEYTSRFNRLDGAIKDLAFSVRKDWKSVPTWLQGYVNSDAHTVGTKEMMAVGRAVIGRWLVEEVFHRYFHPALEANLSMQLKNIEMNLRRQPTNTSTDEDKENAVARISNWRRTTFDGLGDALKDQEAQENRSQLINHLVAKLVESLRANLREPAPPELENGASMIVENTVNICEKIPLESRDVCVEYFLPGTPVSDVCMKVETGLPPLAKVGGQSRMSLDQERPSSARAGDHEDADADRDKDSSSSPSTTATNSPGNSNSSATATIATSQQKEPKKRSIFGSLMTKKSSASSNAPQPPPESAGSRRPSIAITAEDISTQSPPPPAARIRFACFPSVEVRGKGPPNALVKAPVYLIEDGQGR